MISIIVPVYKTEAFIAKCIESIISQTFNNFELILINDGSPDNAGKICEEFAKKDERIIVIHQHNAGVSNARNTGIRIATRKYICFIDSDDEIMPNFLQNFIDNTSPNSQCYIQGFNIINKSKTRKVRFHNQELKPLPLIKLLENKNDVHNGYVWHRMFVTNIIKDHNILFPEEISFAEDGLFFFKYVRFTQNIRTINKIGYNHYISEEGLTNSGKELSFEKLLWLYEEYILSVLKLQEIDNKASRKFLTDYKWRLFTSWFLKRLINQKKDKNSLILIQTFKALLSKYKLVSYSGKKVTSLIYSLSFTQKRNQITLLFLKINYLFTIIEKKAYRIYSRLI